MASSDPLSCMTPAARRDMLARKFMMECRRIASKSNASVIYVPLLKCRLWNASCLAKVDFQSTVELFDAAIGRHFTDRHVLFLLRKDNKVFNDLFIVETA
jgi:hypothetical protein